jgi:hypothetical protein
MPIFTPLISFSRRLLRGQQMERELDDEVRSHLQLLTEQNIEEGMNPHEAARTARIELGGVERVKEEVRAVRAGAWVDTLLQDVRYSVRMLSKSPVLALIIVVTLALGIGANNAIFGIVNGFLLRPLPVRDPEQITVLAIQRRDAPIGSSGFAYPEFVDFRKQAATFSNIFAIVMNTVQMSSRGDADQCFANYVSKDFFASLGVTPVAGRLFLPDEGETLDEPLMAVLGYSYWQRRFHGDAGVVGRQIKINSKTATIIGVVQQRFQGMYSIAETDVYLPLSAISMDESPNLFWNNRDRRGMLVFGRLAPGVSLRQAQNSLDVITGRLATEYPATDKWFTVRAVPEKLARPIPYANHAFVAISGNWNANEKANLHLLCMRQARPERR